MKKVYLGIDIGKVSTKGVLIDGNNKIIASSYLYTEDDPIKATKMVIYELKNKVELGEYKVVGVGITGIFRKLIGRILGINTINNEVMANAVGTTSIYSDVGTIFEIGGYDSKVILLNNGIVTDYVMNNICATGIGIFLSNCAKKLEISCHEFGKIAFTSNNPLKIDIDCIGLMKYDSKIKKKTEDVIAGLCYAVVNNFLNNVCKGIKIKSPIVFQGGVSKNIGIVKAFEDITGNKVYVDENSHLMGALGSAILSQKESETDLSIDAICNIFDALMNEGELIHK